MSMWLQQPSRVSMCMPTARPRPLHILRASEIYFAIVKTELEYKVTDTFATHDAGVC